MSQTPEKLDTSSDKVFEQKFRENVEQLEKTEARRQAFLEKRPDFMYETVEEDAPHNASTSK